MTIHAHLLCWNESRIIPFVMAHYLRFCDKITVWDNGSTDGSLDLLKSYPIEVAIFKSNGFDDNINASIKNECWKKCTEDWIIVVDMDELLYLPNKKDLINCHPLPNIIGYNMFSEAFPNYNTPITEQITLGVKAVNFNKQILFNRRFVQEMNYGPGAHQCTPILKKWVPTTTQRTFKLLHYKYLGLDYLAEKHFQYAKRLSDFNKEHAYGKEYTLQNHLTDSFELLKKHAIKVI